MRGYFCGWYFRCQSDTRTLALIPSFHKTGTMNSCSLQIISDTGVFSLQFPYSDFYQDKTEIRIGKNRFGSHGVSLEIHTKDLDAAGTVVFGPFTSLKYAIMGPFQDIPFMECRHSVFSMRHTVNGMITVNGVPYVFQNGTGYMEGDCGRSFPRKYVWTQCSFPDGALMLSVAEIPFCGRRFTGIIGVVLLHGKEYRLATYLGAKAVNIQGGAVIVRQGDLRLTVRRQGNAGHPLQAPDQGAMVRTIHEHPSCKVHYHFQRDGETLLKLDVSNAAFEYEY